MDVEHEIPVEVNPEVVESNRYFLYFKTIVKGYRTVEEGEDERIESAELYLDKEQPRKVYLDTLTRNGRIEDDQRLTVCNRPDGRGKYLIFTDIPDFPSGVPTGNIPVYVRPEVSDRELTEIFDVEAFRAMQPAGSVRTYTFFDYYPSGQPDQEQIGITIGIGKEPFQPSSAA